MTGRDPEAMHRVVFDGMTHQHVLDVVLPAARPIVLPDRMFGTGPHGEHLYHFRHVVVIHFVTDGDRQVVEYRVLVPRGLSYSGEEVQKACADLLGPVLLTEVRRQLARQADELADAEYLVVEAGVLESFRLIVEADAGRD